jgi:hypothetical protein
MHWPYLCLTEDRIGIGYIIRNYFKSQDHVTMEWGGDCPTPEMVSPSALLSRDSESNMSHKYAQMYIIKPDSLQQLELAPTILTVNRRPQFHGQYS